MQVVRGIHIFFLYQEFLLLYVYNVLAISYYTYPHIVEHETASNSQFQNTEKKVNSKTKRKNEQNKKK